MNNVVSAPRLPYYYKSLKHHQPIYHPKASDKADADFSGQSSHVPIAAGDIDPAHVKRKLKTKFQQKNRYFTLFINNRFDQ